MKKDRKKAIEESGIFLTVLEELFPHAQQSNKDQILVCCVFHEDQNPSLSINRTSGLFNCFACGAAGNFFDLYKKAKSCDFKTALNDLEQRAGIESAPGRTSIKEFSKVVATFTYHDESGKPLYVKKRYEPGFGQSGRTKSFVFYHSVNGREKKGRGGEPVLYNLHLISKAKKNEPLFFVEGEGKADLLSSLRFLATTLDSGGQSGKGSAWREGFEIYCKNREIYLLPDRDKTGEAYITAIADKLLAVAKCVKILRLPGLPAKGDIIDWYKINEEQV